MITDFLIRHRQGMILFMVGLGSGFWMGDWVATRSFERRQQEAFLGLMKQGFERTARPLSRAPQSSTTRPSKSPASKRSFPSRETEPSRKTSFQDQWNARRRAFYQEWDRRQKAFNRGFERSSKPRTSETMPRS